MYTIHYEKGPNQIYFSELKIDAGGDDQLSSFHSESSQQDFPNKQDFTENIEIYFRDFIKIHHDTKALVNYVPCTTDRPLMAEIWNRL